MTSIKTIFSKFCGVCHNEFQEDQLCVAVGLPYMVVLHDTCAPFFKYRDGWPHPMPYDYYDNNSIFRN